jgi:serine protease AprX
MQDGQTQNTLTGRVFFTFCTLILATSLAFAGPSQTSPKQVKISPDLKEANLSGQIDVIVQFKQVPTTTFHQKVLSRGGKIKTDLGQFKGGAYTMPVSALTDLASDPDVVYISPDRPLNGASQSSTPVTLDYHTAAINAPAAWAEGLNGAGVGVALIDSGIALNSDISPFNVIYNQDFTGAFLGSAADQFGHGTHVAGILAGTGATSTGPKFTYTFHGIAENVNLINLRVLDQNGAGTDSQVIAAIQQAIALKSLFNIRVINLSLGRPVWESYTTDPLCQAVEQAWKAGIVVVVAAGNYGRDNNAGTNGYGTITAPGNDPYVITVGAMNTKSTAARNDDVIASYSSKGPALFDQVIKPDLVAPGNRIISIYSPWEALSQEYPGNIIPKSLYETNNGAAASGNYFILSGTSMAAPTVSGAAALMLQQSPSLTPDQVKARLMKTAFKNLQQSSTATDPDSGITYYDQADIFTVGAGYLDIEAALADSDLAPAIAGSAMSPTATVDSTGNIVLVPNGSSVLGGNSAFWGAAASYGSSVLWGTSVSGRSVLWGSSSLEGESVLWSTSVVESDSVLWGTSVLWGSSASTPELNIDGDN